MSIIVSGLKKAVGLFRPTLNKEYFLKKLRKITDHPGLYSQGELEQRLIYQYENRGNEVANWLIEVATDKKEKIAYRESAISCMNFYIKKPEIKDCLLKFAEDENANGHICLKAIEKLSIIKDEKLLPLFTKLLSHEDYSIRREAAYAIVKIGGQEAYKTLKSENKKATHTNTSHLENALDEFQEQIDSDVMRHLQSVWFSNGETEMREKRRGIMDKFIQMYGEETVLGTLVNIAVEDYDRRTTYEALNCLEEVKDREKVFKVLIETLRDRS